MFRRILARHQRSPRGRTDGAGSIALSEFHPGGGQLLDMWRFLIIGSVAPQIGPAEIINHNENDIGADVDWPVEVSRTG